jgi:hypothetical protein
MARGLLHGIVAVTASAHSPVPPPLTVMPPPSLPPAPDASGFRPLPPPRPPSTELGRALPSSQHDGRQLAHSTTIVGSGSIVGNVFNSSLMDYVRATRPCALTSDAAPRSHAPRALLAHLHGPSCPLALASHVLCTQPIAVAVSGSYAYVAGRYSNSLTVVDISNPASPVIRGSVVSSSLLAGVSATQFCDRG